MLVSYTSSQQGHFPGLATDVAKLPVQICASDSQPSGGGKCEVMPTFLTRFTERINELISIKYLASHR